VRWGDVPEMNSPLSRKEREGMVLPLALRRRGEKNTGARAPEVSGMRSILRKKKQRGKDGPGGGGEKKEKWC